MTEPNRQMINDLRKGNMTVKELIKELKKMPKDCDVVFSAHDHDSTKLDEQETFNHVNIEDFYVGDYKFQIVIRSALLFTPSI